MLETIHTGINSKTQDVVPLGKCTGKPCVQQGMQLQLSQFKKKKKDLRRFKKDLKILSKREMQIMKSMEKLHQ